MLSYIHHISDPKLPTLVLLHGYGSNKEDLYGLKPYLPKLNIVSFQAPISLGMGGYAWYPIEWENGAKMIDGDAVEEAAQLVLESLKTWQKQHVESNEVFIGGFSQGAITSLQILLQGFSAKGFVLMSGYALPEWHEALKSISTDAPIFQSHGTMDPVIPYTWAQATAEGLSHSRDYTFRSYPMAHSLNAQCLQDIHEFLTPLLE
ncbi:MAG: dienelactone hydrolase family protein [Schleiferiaceae bacterium]|nr:dienelactone hydrolase family protein [Schleiferiaceae bacterium]